jgi:hypothetical protein
VHNFALVEDIKLFVQRKKPMAKEDIHVTIDIAGMYYRRSIDVPKGSTIKEIMEALKVSDQTATDFQLDYSTEKYAEREFIDGISVRHLQPAVSRQDSTRTYDAGLYEYYDDGVTVQDGRFVPSDPNKSYVLAWQYYVYDANGRDRDRANVNSTRTVVPFSEQKINDVSLIVWRLVAIFLKPSYGHSLKVARALSNAPKPYSAA